MKVAQYNEYGGPEVIKISNNAPKPTAGKGQILVEVHAASLNPFDYKLREGFMKEMIPLQFPFTIGGDFSGIVTQLAENVSEFKIGDEVYGQAIVLQTIQTLHLPKYQSKPQRKCFEKSSCL